MSPKEIGYKLRTGWLVSLQPDRTYFKGIFSKTIPLFSKMPVLNNRPTLFFAKAFCRKVYKIEGKEVLVSFKERKARVWQTLLRIKRSLIRNLWRSPPSSDEMLKMLLRTKRYQNTKCLLQLCLYSLSTLGASWTSGFFFVCLVARKLTGNRRDLLRLSIFVPVDCSCITILERGTHVTDSICVQF